MIEPFGQHVLAFAAACGGIDDIDEKFKEFGGSLVQMFLFGEIVRQQSLPFPYLPGQLPAEPEIREAGAGEKKKVYTI